MENKNANLKNIKGGKEVEKVKQTTQNKKNSVNRKIKNDNSQKVENGKVNGKSALDKQNIGKKNDTTTAIIDKNTSQKEINNVENKDHSNSQMEENVIVSSVAEKPLKYESIDGQKEDSSVEIEGKNSNNTSEKTNEKKSTEDEQKNIKTDNSVEENLAKEKQLDKDSKQKNADIDDAEKDDFDNLSPLGRVVARQREYFETNKTLDVNYRLLQLKRLRLQIKAYYDQICSAFRQDLNKLEFDVVLTELGIVMKELNYTISNLLRLAKPKKVSTSFANFPSKGYVLRDPYGVVMIASPWNYPLQLTLVPLIGAIAGGNTAIIKPSRNTPNISKVIKKMLSIFDEDYVYVVTKDEEIADIFDTKFDFIFYTGSPKKAREIAEKQAKFLTPMILELGGKSPCIVDKDANIDLSAKRIVWGKFLNAGQTCVAPDYVLVHSEIKDKFVESAKKWIGKFYYEHHLDAQKEEFLPTFVKIAKKSDVARLQNLMKDGVVECGGKVHGQVVEPTLLTGIDWDSKIMQEEVFGPIMPVLTFDDLDEVVKKIRSLDKPLALYYFGKDKDCIQKVKTQIAFGGGCINDTIMHMTEEKLPFGGVGNSGMGNYHGARTFYAFTREKAVLDKGLWFDLNLRYPQSSKGKIRFAKSYFKI